VFALNANGTETVLYSFTEARDGGEPEAGLAVGSNGNLFGTTSHGGTYDSGNAFEVTVSGHLRVLHSFGPLFDGLYPYAGLVQDPAGNLYGTTTQGGNGGDYGSVFKVVACGAETPLCPEKVMYSFTGSNDIDGAWPESPLLLDGAGNLYGTTYYGGLVNCNPLGNEVGCGIVFKLSPSGKETVLYRFAGGTDGGNPVGGLVRDSQGNLYGTTSLGGAYNQGTTYKLDASGNETILHSFSGPDGLEPTAGLILDGAGNLYGTTSGGGTNGGGGTIFKLDASGTETVLYSLNGTTDGYDVHAGLVMDAEGNLYGTAHFGGAPVGGYGTVFELTP
jgi:uncharacterized repeat protein (TIGR03803 family)